MVSMSHLLCASFQDGDEAACVNIRSVAATVTGPHPPVTIARAECIRGVIDYRVVVASLI
jgi:hypothetical protein